VHIVLPNGRCSISGRFVNMNVCLTILSLCLGLAFAAPRVDPDLDSHWQLWKSWHSKDYHEVSACWVAPGMCVQLSKCKACSAGPHQLSHDCFVLMLAMICICGIKSLSSWIFLLCSCICSVMLYCFSYESGKTSVSGSVPALLLKAFMFA